MNEKVKKKRNINFVLQYKNSLLQGLARSVTVSFRVQEQYNL